MLRGLDFIGNGCILEGRKARPVKGLSQKSSLYKAFRIQSRKHHHSMVKSKEVFVMNKAELTAAIVKKTGFTKKDAEKAIAALTEVITESLAEGDKVQIVGFGGFEVRERPARVARNPRTGEQIKIAASKAPAFKAGKALKDSVNK